MADIDHFSICSCCLIYWLMYVGMYACMMYTYRYICMYVFIKKNTFLCICSFMYVHIYIFVCLFVCLFVYLSPFLLLLGWTRYFALSVYDSSNYSLIIFHITCDFCLLKKAVLCYSWCGAFPRPVSGQPDSEPVGLRWVSWRVCSQIPGWCVFRTWSPPSSDSVYSELEIIHHQMVCIQDLKSSIPRWISATD